MRPFIWVVSYPRSGNTFLRALLANYFSGSTRPLSLAEVSSSTLGEHSETLWLELTGHRAADRTIEMEWRARPAYIRARRERAEGDIRLFKSHTVNGSAFGELNAFDFVPGDRILHVVRHPGDVALSCADYWGIPLDAAIDRLLTDGLVTDGAAAPRVRGARVMGPEHPTVAGAHAGSKADGALFRSGREHARHAHRGRTLPRRGAGRPPHSRRRRFRGFRDPGRPGGSRRVRGGRTGAEQPFLPGGTHPAMAGAPLD